jgi:hypothetical protein
MNTEATRPSGANDESLPLAEDLLQGADAIAVFIYGNADEANRRRVYHAAGKRELPTFYFNGKVCARKSTIMKRFAEREASGA